MVLDRKTKTTLVQVPQTKLFVVGSPPNLIVACLGLCARTPLLQIPCGARWQGYVVPSLVTQLAGTNSSDCITAWQSPMSLQSRKNH